MIKPRHFLLAALLAGCSSGGSGPATVAPSNSAKGAVDRFMQAVADSNLTQMATLWGTSAGPASRTGQPPDYERRIAIMHAYLRNESHRIVSDAPEGGDTRHAVQVEIRRQLCSWVVPFTTIKLGDGTWIVSQVDLTQAGNPGRSCEPGAQQDTTSQE
ncbi:MAG TPA: hypothetical protein VG500_09620 [Gemmatimonadales bacterium]|nr:hypothetical protein [Gemmatimonadales bacterium]